MYNIPPKPILIIKAPILVDEIRVEMQSDRMMVGYPPEGKNPYDMRINCEHGRLCYDFDMITTPGLHPPSITSYGLGFR